MRSMPGVERREHLRDTVPNLSAGALELFMPFPSLGSCGFGFSC